MNTEQVAQDKVVQRSVDVEKYKVEAIAKRAEAKELRDKAITRNNEKKVENAKANNRVVLLRE
jgi:hypothetical protein